MQTAVELHWSVRDIGISIGEMTNHHRKLNAINKDNKKLFKRTNLKNFYFAY